MSRTLVLNTLRRGPTPPAASSFSASLCSQCARINHRGARQSFQRIPYLVIPRLFGTSSQWRRSATASAAYEEEAVEGELEQEVHAEEPPSDSQINQATKHGPITKFKDLAERGLVCKTVVDTITHDMGLDTMTQVQSLTLNESLKGTDM